MADNQTNETQGEIPSEQAPQSAAPQSADRAPAPSEGDSVAHEGGRRGRGERGERGGRGRGPGRPERTGPADGLDEVVVKIYRCATVVKGGRRFSFGALVVVGDHNGRVGIGYGKANEVPSAVEKGAKAARRNMINVNLSGSSIPHLVLSKYRASKVKMIPAGEGTGVIAGASVRAVMELAGVKDVLTKVYGSTSPKNLVKAAFEGLAALRTKEDVGKLREVAVK
ncbi:MAG: 30S ribosomal protein S5 [Planctomycetes bacterium]|nr:30S ribosomal protein S5 [Planctomycetota bacterium]